MDPQKSHYHLSWLVLLETHWKVRRPGLASEMYLTFLEVYSYRPYLKLLICCGKRCVSKLRGVAYTQTTLPDNWKGSNDNDDNDDDNTFCIFQIEIIVKVRAPTLNNKMSATGTPRTSRSALPFEIQQNSLAIERGNEKNNASNIEKRNKFMRL